jgi:hypothetical protein
MSNFKLLRFLALGIISLAGILSILATSPLPPDGYLYIVTLNNPEAFSNDYGGGESFACKDDFVKVGWELKVSKKALLSTIPVDGVEPGLNEKTLSGTGEEQVKVIAQTDFLFDTISDSYPTFTYKLNLLPNDICTGFPVRPVGIFSGKLEQTIPTSATLPRDLQLQWNGSSLLAIVRSDQTSISSSCTLDATSDSISCENERDGTVLFKLEGQMSATGFAGSYEGISTDLNSQLPFAGTFSFSPKETEE